MKISAENAIEIFIDCFEGKLSADEKAELMHWLSLHPEWEKEFYQLQAAYLLPAESNKVDFSHLIKDINQRTEINADNFEELCIAELEGDLYHPILRGQLYQWINASETNRKTFNLYRLAKAQPDERIVFPNKKILKRREKSQTLVWIYRSVALAASIALLIGLGWWMDKSTTKNVTVPAPLISSQNIEPQVSINEKPTLASAPSKVKNIIQPDFINAIDTTPKIQRQAIEPISELMPKTALAETYFPKQNFIVIDEKIFYRNLFNEHAGESNLTLNEWMNDQLNKWKNKLLNLPAEYSRIKRGSYISEQMRLLANDHVIFRQNTDTLYGRKQVEVNLGWVALYFSYTTKP